MSSVTTAAFFSRFGIFELSQSGILLFDLVKGAQRLHVLGFVELGQYEYKQQSKDDMWQVVEHVFANTEVEVLDDLLETGNDNAAGTGGVDEVAAADDAGQAGYHYDGTLLGVGLELKGTADANYKNCGKSECVAEGHNSGQDSANIHTPDNAGEAAA